ncbi:rhomboid family intramembrane serine protease [Rhodovulum visakhapatnamense]|uniref:Membrane associated rhomboid family serine protease n=1 Tax=Rhodovulum visakhapatnamense TaxID=364297 RepID=A0A4R8FDP6_9RHOB|nr:rhomboid family intramembrane serine protease [Rhodovulum visakhapatnamense]TDX21585.1 membrane associated rhomboid family serine protease [Rhodovulum visakhapatnamense]
MAVLSRGNLMLWGLIACCTSIELVLSLSDAGVLFPARLRSLAYDYGGFWPGLLGSWQPNYPAQPYLMFFTYGFLHGGLAHLAVNMVTLWSLGRAVLRRVGAMGLALLYGGSILGGAAGFAALAPDLRPMVGASGALFGLIGGLLAWIYVDRYTYREGLWPVVRAVVLLAVLNVVLWWAMDEQLAWQTHLGGFVAGWVLALLIDPRPGDAEDDPA